MRRIISTLALWAVYVPIAHAQDFGNTQLTEVADKANLGSATPLPVLIGNLVRIAIGMLGIVFLVLTIYAGFLYLTARGEEEKVTHAKQTLSRGVIGLIIISAAYAIASFVISALTASVKTST